MEAVIEIRDLERRGVINSSDVSEVCGILPDQVRTQMNNLAVDLTGGYLQMIAYDNIKTGATGIDSEGDTLSYEGRGGWNESDVRGAVFAIEFYREVFPIARALFPLPQRGKYL